jgi:Domain of unknown function (DUF3127)
MEITGAIERISETKFFTKKDGNQGSKLEFIVKEIDMQYPQRFKFTALNRMVDTLDSLSVGEMVKVNFNINATDFNENTFNNLNIYKIEKI